MIACFSKAKTKANLYLPNQKLYLVQKSCFVPQQRKLGVFSHSKGSGAGRSSQIRWEPGSLEGSLEEVPFTRESLGARSAWRKVGNRVPRKRFPSKVSQQGSPEPVPKQWFPARGSQAKFLSKVPRNRFPSKGSQARFPGTGSQARVPSKRFPGTGSQARFPGKVPKQGSQEEAPSKRFPSKVTRNRLPSKGSQARFPETGSQARFPSKGS